MHQNKKSSTQNDKLSLSIDPKFCKKARGWGSHAPSKKKSHIAKNKRLWTDYGKLGLCDYKILMKTHMVCEPSPRFFFRGGEGSHLSGRVKITPGKWILRLPVPNGQAPVVQKLDNNPVDKQTAVSAG